MQRRDVLTTAAAIVFAGCIGGGGNEKSGGDTANESATTDDAATTSTETSTSATATATAPNTGETTQGTTTAPQTTTGSTDTPTHPTSTTAETDTPIPVPDQLDTPQKDGPLTNVAHVVFKNGGTRIVVTGTITGKNGCQKPVHSVRKTNSGLIITVATERDAPKNALCTMALTELEYRFDVTVETVPKSVTIIHRGVTGKQTMTTAKPNG